MGGVLDHICKWSYGDLSTLSQVRVESVNLSINLSKEPRRQKKVRDFTPGRRESHQDLNTHLFTVI